MNAAASALILALSSLAGAQAWEPGPTLPTGGPAKVSAVGVRVGNTIYALGGTPWTGSGDGSVYALHLGSPGWSEELGFDGYGPVLSQGGGIDGLGRIFIFGGWDTDADEAAGSFDWDPAEGPWHDLAMRSVSAPATGFAYCTDDVGRVYSLGGGGGEGGGNQSHAERYIASSDSWELIASLPVPTGDAAAVDDGLGHILVIGGVSDSGDARLTEVQQYDIASDTWSTTAVPDLPVGVSAARAVRDASGKIYLLGGRDGPVGSGSTRNEVLIYDPSTGAWASGPTMAVPRRDFAAVLAGDEFIYVIGGDNDSGGTNTVERMHPSDCPVFNLNPEDAAIWRGGTLGLTSEVVGSAPIAIRWYRGDTELTDGPAAHGSLVSGATTAALTITNAQSADSGAYTAVASNTCGTTASDPAVATVRVQVPLPTHWTMTNLHPGYADSSVANDVEDGVQVGKAIWDTPEYNNIDHPVIWHGSAGSVVNATPTGSQGGSINAISGDALVGWWWRPFEVVGGTAYYRRASVWTVSGVHRYPAASGWEYHLMNDTNGTLHVGSQTNDDASGNYWTHAVIWSEPSLSPLDLHPADYSSSYLNAIDGDSQYGSVNTPYPAPSPRAAKWSGTRDSFVSMHPEGASNSSVTGAGDGQQVGVVNQWNSPVAALWAGSAASYTPFVAPGFVANALSGCEGGFQFGTVTYADGHSSAYLWRGNPEEGIDVGAVSGTTFTSTYANGMDIEPDGTIVVVGQGFNPAAGRFEALMWRGTAGCGIADIAEPYGVLDFFDVLAFLSRFSAGDSSADVNSDGVLDFFDVAAYLAAFSEGCP